MITIKVAKLTCLLTQTLGFIYHILTDIKSSSTNSIPTLNKMESGPDFHAYIINIPNFNCQLTIYKHLTCANVVTKERYWNEKCKQLVGQTYQSPVMST